MEYEQVLFSLFSQIQVPSVVYTWMLIDPPDLTGSSLNSFTKFIL